MKKPENNLFLSLFTKRFLVFYCVSAKIQKLFAKKLFSNKIIGYNWANVCIISTSSLKCAKNKCLSIFCSKRTFLAPLTRLIILLIYKKKQAVLNPKIGCFFLQKHRFSFPKAIFNFVKPQIRNLTFQRPSCVYTSSHYWICR